MVRIKIQYKVGEKILGERTIRYNDEEHAERLRNENGRQLKNQILKEYKGYKTGVMFGPPTSIPYGYIETPQAYTFALKGELIYTDVT